MVRALGVVLLLPFTCVADTGVECSEIVDDAQRRACYGGDVHGEAIEEAKKIVVSEFFDPESARFRDVFVSSVWRRGSRVVCGEVNGKNRYGGYVGYRKFYVADGSAEILDPPSLPEGRQFYEKVWEATCKRKK